MAHCRCSNDIGTIERPSTFVNTLMLETIKQYWNRYVEWREQMLKEAYNIDDDTNESTEDRD